MSETTHEDAKWLQETIQEAIIAMQEMADAESQGYPDEYHNLLDAYHHHYDPSWQPQGYGMRTRDPLKPLPPVDMSQIPMLEADSSPLYRFVSQLQKR